jgi:hypothetical protein
MSKQRIAAAVMAACLLAMPRLGWSQEPAGHILWAFGQVERVGADGVAKPLAKGDAVFEGDVIRSAAGSHAQLVMSDEALVAVRAESSVKLTKYSYHGAEDGTERAIIDLLKGGLRSVTGAIGRTNKDSYQLRNDMHVIGIRGTDHETYVNDAGIFSRVSVGGTYIQGPEGRVDVAPGQIAFASRRQDFAPLHLAHTPQFMQVAALSRANSGPQLRGPSASDERRLQKGLDASSVGISTAATNTVLPTQALTESGLQQSVTKDALVPGVSSSLVGTKGQPILRIPPGKLK